MEPKVNNVRAEDPQAEEVELLKKFKDQKDAYNTLYWRSIFLNALLIIFICFLFDTQPIFNLFKNLKNYDCVIDVDSVLSLQETNGWPVIINNPDILAPNQSSICAVTGGFNSGKTYLISRLEGINLPEGSGIDTVTPAFAFVKSKESSNNILKILLDTQGYHRPISSSLKANPKFANITERIITDRYIAETTKLVSNQFIYVFDQLSIQDIFTISKLEQETTKMNRVLIVINYQKFTDPQKLINQFNSDMKSFKSATNDCDIPNNYLSYFLDQNYIRILALGREGSNAGKFNAATFKYIKSTFLFKGVINQKKIMESFIDVGQTVMKRYFGIPSENLYNTKPIITRVFDYNLEEKEENQKDSFKLVYTQATSENNGSIVLPKTESSIVMVPLDYVVGEHALHYDLVNQESSYKLIVHLPGQKEVTIKCKDTTVTIIGKAIDAEYGENQIINQYNRILHANFAKRINIDNMHCLKLVPDGIGNYDVVNGVLTLEIPKAPL
ncbi:HSP20-like chaperone domain-containing protein [Heterostelium album PN500]|uniref:HSP20-like chaperone domain-containing protein n=1 Tax=Heterostelium pallidum (strain ATCC 26659 / Pp 5 / PN500) TaxID=670386 RepID=D3B2P3_HETP5|nr:HSP20-like chaperone domain-containing protein [Heterostelium album PN500]EFA83591.1 HSP20-like chaperone domain-containing protein [Heterostelium album PN500]|eukprot:XP_020435708.1 HSP20-like chaperone domain-containing protein [Heterostelium album PN500]